MTINVVGTPGSGFTTWSFSGSAIATENGAFLITDIGETDSTQWKNIGDYVSSDTLNNSMKIINFFCKRR
ncbi:MAG: hypothetical protein ACK58N_08440 [Synechocystis sp.]